MRKLKKTDRVAIVCPVCGWHPSRRHWGGKRWKLLCQHVYLLHSSFPARREHNDLLADVKLASIGVNY